MKTLYATDLDGTLLDSDARLSAYTAQRLCQLQDMGALITFVTARTPATVRGIMAPGDPRLPGVVMTGAAIWDPRSQQYLHVKYHESEHALAINEICRQHNIFPFIYTMPRGSNHLNVFHAAKSLGRLEESFVNDRELCDLKHFLLNTPMPDGAQDHTVLFFAMGAPDSIRRAAQAICAATGCNASCYPDTYHPGVALLEVFSPAVSKAQGILELKEMVGADRIVAFGDNLNDIPLLEAADLAVAVDNANLRVKEVSHFVIGPNTADSVVDFIAEDFEIYEK